MEIFRPVAAKFSQAPIFWTPVRCGKPIHAARTAQIGLHALRPSVIPRLEACFRAGIQIETVPIDLQVNAPGTITKPAIKNHEYTYQKSISNRETSLWAGLTVASAVGCLIWGIATSTMGPGALVLFGLMTLVNFLYQSARLSEMKYDKQFLPLTDNEKKLAHSPSAPSVAVLIPAYAEPPHVLKKTILSAALLDYAKRDVVLLNDNDPKVAAQARETEQINGLIAEINALFDKGKETVAKIYHESPQEISLAADYIANRLLSINKQLGADEDLTDQYSRDRVFLKRAEHFKALAQAYKDQPLTADKLADAWRELLVFFDVQVAQFERKAFANLPGTKNKATNVNAYLSLDGQAWVVGTDEQGKKLIVAPDSEQANSLRNKSVLNFGRHDYFMIIDADTRIFPNYLTEAVPFMEREDAQNVTIFQSPTWSLPSDNPVQHIGAFEMNMAGLLEKGHTVQDNACWAGSNGVLRGSVLRAIMDQPTDPQSPYRKTIRDDTVIEDYETDLFIKTNFPASRTVYAKHPLCILINPKNWGELEIQRQRWANGPLKLLIMLLRSAKQLPLKVLLNRLYRYVYYSINIVIALNLVASVGQFAGNPFIYLYLLTGFVSYFRPIKKRGFTFMNSQLALMSNLLLTPTYFKGQVSTVWQIITGKKIPFNRTPKDGQRTRISLSSSLFSLGTLGKMLTELGADVAQLLVNGNYMFNVMHLYTTILLAYAIHKLLGFRNIISDLVFLAESAARRFSRRSQIH